MKLQEIRFKNFWSFGNKLTTVCLDNNQNNLIVGQNGHGKSAILYALFYAVTGKPYPKGVKVAQLINCHTKKDCLVELDFEHGLSQYTIRRGQKPKVFEIIKDGTLLDENSNSVDYQQVIEQIFGMDANTFKQCIVMSARNYTPFLELESAKRREFIEEIFAIHNLSSMKDLVKSEETVLIEAQRQNEYQMGVVSTRLTTIEEYKLKEIANAKEKIAVLQEEQKILEEDVITLRTTYSNLKSELTSLQTSLDKMQSDIDDQIQIDKHVRELEFQLDSNEQRLKTAEQTQIQCQNDIATQKQVIEDTCNSLKLNNIKKSELQENHQASVEKNNSSALSEIQTQIRTAVSSISSLKTTKESLWKQKQFYDSKPTCPTCGQDIDPKFVSSLDLDEKLSEIESEVAVLSKTLIDLEDRSAKIASEISIANKLDIELQNLCITIQHLETAKVNADKKIDSLTKNLETIDISISDMTKKRLEFHDKIGIAKQNLRHDILLMKAALQICKREQMGMTAQLATMAELGKNQSKRITAIIAEIEQLNRPSISFEDEEDCKTKKVLIEDQIEQTKKKLFYISTIKKMLSDTGIRKFILRRYVPIMNGLVNKYLNLLGAKYQIAFDEEMNEKIIARGYEELGLGNLSGGQIQRVDLALMFAFLEMAKMRNSVRTNLIFFDEILDMSLDADGLDGVFTIFNTLKQLGYTLYVISHRPEMTNKFDSVLTINMKTFSEVSKA